MILRALSGDEYHVWLLYQHTEQDLLDRFDWSGILNLQLLDGEFLNAAIFIEVGAKGALLSVEEGPQEDWARPRD